MNFIIKEKLTRTFNKKSFEFIRNKATPSKNYKKKIGILTFLFRSLNGHHCLYSEERSTYLRYDINHILF